MMETFQVDQAGDKLSLKAQCSQWENSTDGGSVIDENLIMCRTPTLKQENNGPKVVIEDKTEEVEDSLYLINDLLNPFQSVVRYLTKNGYINKKDQVNKDDINHRVLACVEEFSQNFYYAFIAQAVLKIGKGILNPSTKLLPNLSKILSRNNLSMWAFLAIMGAGYKLSFEKLRQLSDKYDKVNTLVSIGLAAFSLLQKGNKMKKNYMYVFLMWKYLETMTKILEKGKVIKKVRKLEVEFYELAILSFSLRFSFRVNISRKTENE